MPSTYWGRVGLVLATLVVAYAVAVSGNVLLGSLLAAVVYLLAWLIDRLSPGNPLDGMTRERTAAAGALVVLVLAYSLVVASALLLGVVVAAVVFFVVWATNPYGPVARWLDRAT